MSIGKVYSWKISGAKWSLRKQGEREREGEQGLMSRLMCNCVTEMIKQPACGTSTCFTTGTSTIFSKVSMTVTWKKKWHQAYNRNVCLNHFAFWVLPWKPHKSCGWIPQPPPASPQGRGPGRDDAFARECGRGCPGRSVHSLKPKLELIWKYSRKADWLANEYTWKNIQVREKNLASHLCRQGSMYSIWGTSTVFCTLSIAQALKYSFNYTKEIKASKNAATCSGSFQYKSWMGFLPT